MRFPIESSPAEATLRGFRLSKSHRFSDNLCFSRKRTLSPDCQPRGSPLLRDQPDATNLFCALYPALRTAAAQLLSLDVPQARCVVYGQKTLLFHRVLLPSCVQHLFFFVLYTLCRRLYLIRRPCFFACGNSALFFFPFFLYNDSTSVNTRLYPNGTDEYRRE